MRLYPIKVSCLLALLPSVASAIDLHPNDIIAPPPGIQMIQINHQRIERTDFYKNNAKTLTGGSIDSSLTQLRYGRSFELGARPAYFYVQAPITDISTSGTSTSLSSNSGAGDTSFAFALWPYANRETEKYMGVAAYLTVPTGSYDSSKSLNPGENRYRWALQAGYEQLISKRVYWMSAFDTLWFGENNDHATTHTVQKQKALYSAQTAFTYKINSTYSTAVGYFYSTGGESNLNGMSRDDRIQNQRYQITGTAKLPFGRISLQYGQELRTKNGFIEDSRWIIRYSRFFK